jgi:hypothetical protein
MPDTQTGRPGGGLCAGHSPLPTARGAGRPATESLARDLDLQDPRPVLETAVSVSPRLRVLLFPPNHLTSSLTCKSC